MISVYIIMVFFATVTSSDRDTWAIAALCVILEEFFLGPFLVAAGCALLATFTVEGDNTIALGLKEACKEVQREPHAAWAASAEDFRVPVPAQEAHSQLRSLGSAQEAPALPLADVEANTQVL